MSVKIFPTVYQALYARNYADKMAVEATKSLREKLKNTLGVLVTGKKKGTSEHEERYNIIMGLMKQVREDPMKFSAGKVVYLTKSQRQLQVTEKKKHIIKLKAKEFVERAKKAAGIGKANALGIQPSKSSEYKKQADIDTTEKILDLMLKGYKGADKTLLKLEAFDILEAEKEKLKENVSFVPPIIPPEIDEKEEIIENKPPKQETQTFPKLVDPEKLKTAPTIEEIGPFQYEPPEVIVGTTGKGSYIVTDSKTGIRSKIPAAQFIRTKITKDKPANPDQVVVRLMKEIQSEYLSHLLYHITDPLKESDFFKKWLMVQTDKPKSYRYDPYAQHIDKRLDELSKNEILITKMIIDVYVRLGR